MTERKNDELISQFALHVAAGKAKDHSASVQNKASSRSRNFDKIHDAQNSKKCKDAFNTNKASILNGKNPLLKMFTTFLSNEGKVFNSRKASEKYELVNPFTTQESISNLLKKKNHKAGEQDKKLKIKAK